MYPTKYKNELPKQKTKQAPRYKYCPLYGQLIFYKTGDKKFPKSQHKTIKNCVSILIK